MVKKRAVWGLLTVELMSKRYLLGFKPLFKAFQNATKLIPWMGWLGILFTVYKSDIHL